jgi:hypothetical protein
MAIFGVCLLCIAAPLLLFRVADEPPPRIDPGASISLVYAVRADDPAAAELRALEDLDDPRRAVSLPLPPLPRGDLAEIALPRQSTELPSTPWPEPVLGPSLASPDLRRSAADAWPLPPAPAEKLKLVAPSWPLWLEDGQAVLPCPLAAPVAPPAAGAETRLRAVHLGGIWAVQMISGCGDAKLDALALAAARQRLILREAQGKEPAAEGQLLELAVIWSQGK